MIKIKRRFSAALKAGLVKCSVLAFGLGLAPHGHAMELTGAVVQLVFEMFEIDSDTIIAKSRRMTAFGVWIGAGAEHGANGDETVGTASAGFGFHLFKDPAFELDEIKDRIKDAVFRVVKPDQLEKYKKMDEAARKQLVRNLALEVKASLKGLIRQGPSNWPKSYFVLNAEYMTAFQEPDRRQARLGVGIGLSRFTLSLTGAAEFAEDYDVILGPEIGTSFLLGSGPRPYLLEVFTRYDYRLLADGRRRSLTIGTRLMLDFI